MRVHGAGQSRKLSLPVMSRTEASSIEIGGGLAQFGGAGGAAGAYSPADDDQVSAPSERDGRTRSGGTQSWNPANFLLTHGQCDLLPRN